MKILLGYSTCEHTTRALTSMGHDVWTCDLRESEWGYAQHLQMDIWQAIEMGGWGAALFHPTCTYLTVSAAWAFNEPNYTKYPGVGYHQRVKAETLVGQARRDARSDAFLNFKRLLDLPFPVVCENPCPSFLSKRFGTPQTIQPYEHGCDASKRTGLWTNELAEGFVMRVTEYVTPRIVDGKPRWGNQTDSGQNRHSPSADRWLIRSKDTGRMYHHVGLQYGKFLADIEEELNRQVA